MDERLPWARRQRTALTGLVPIVALLVGGNLGGWLADSIGRLTRSAPSWEESPRSSRRAPSFGGFSVGRGLTRLTTPPADSLARRRSPLRQSEWPQRIVCGM